MLLATELAEFFKQLYLRKDEINQPEILHGNGYTGKVNGKAKKIMALFLF